MCSVALSGTNIENIVTSLRKRVLLNQNVCRFRNMISYDIYCIKVTNDIKRTKGISRDPTAKEGRKQINQIWMKH